MIDLVASEPHFLDHLIPVWRALPAEQRGSIWTGKMGAVATDVLGRAKAHGVQMKAGPPIRAESLMVASIGDLSRGLTKSPHAKVAFFEHGCGLRYKGVSNPSYLGSPSRPNCSVILVPNEMAAELQRTATPDIPVVVLGGEPRLDAWYGLAPAPSDRPVVCVSWHWDCKVVPETRTALYEHRGHLRWLLDRGWTVIGHAHPRIWPAASAVYRRLGIEMVEQFDEVLRRAHLYAVDNSSTLYEFAALDRPVVAINATGYRRNVDHGLRFWDHVPGIQCDRPEELPREITSALIDAPELQNLRRSALAAVFPRSDGHVAERAASAVVEYVGDGSERLVGVD